MKQATVLAAMCLVLTALTFAPAEAAEGKRYALIVGVRTYRPGQPLPELPFTENDAVDLTTTLEAGGYQVTLMTQTVGRTEGKDLMAPLSDYIRDQLDALLDNPFLTDDDVVIVALTGHGVQYELIEGDGENATKTPKFYFCPGDAEIAKVKTANDITDRNRLLDLGELYEALNKCKAGGKLLLVDACRNDPTKPGLTRSLASATLPALPPPPGGTAAFFSCSAHQKAFEDAELKHGVFFHHVIEALRGDADSSTAKRAADGQITLSELSEHVSSSTYDYVRKKYSGAKQAPELKGEFRLTVPLIEVTRKRELPTDITNSIGMKLKLIPAGEFLMGSSDADVAAALKADSNLTEDYLKDERPQHRVKISRPFYAGVYEVTQGEFEAVMGMNPSHFSSSGGGSDKVGGMNTKRFPVESVSWYDAIEFCNKLSQRENLRPHYSLASVEREDGRITSATVSLASGGRQSPDQSGYRLPTEAEWEYLCRAGTTSAYNFGNVLNGDRANVDGNYPFGTTTKGSYLERPTDVGSYASNRFGLHDVHGNVWEWCFDVYDESAYVSRSGITTDPLSSSGSEYRVLRGGSWLNYSRFARSAYRYRNRPVGRSNDFGFRVVR